MKIFHNDFISLLKKVFVCSIIEHDMHWCDHHWAIGHSSGYSVHVCLRCGYKDFYKMNEMWSEEEKVREPRIYTTKEWMRDGRKKFTIRGKSNTGN